MIYIRFRVRGSGNLGFRVVGFRVPGAEELNTKYRHLGLDSKGCLITSHLPATQLRTGI